jgi:hypothetical protein
LPPSPAGLRHAAAATLHGASRALQRLAQHLADTPARPRAVLPAPLLEFHAEAGAPEGALFVDGQWVGFVPGVRRL